MENITGAPALNSNDFQGEIPLASVAGARILRPPKRTPKRLRFGRRAMGFPDGRRPREPGQRRILFIPGNLF